jgi:hypothetical protein
MKILVLFLLFTVISCTQVYTPKEQIRDVTDSFEVRCIKGKKYFYRFNVTEIYLLNVDDDGKPIKCE